MSSQNSKLFVISLVLLVKFAGAYYYLRDRSDVIDFIVVGAGNAGCVVASRLSESGKRTVLLLESGGHPHPDMSIPAIAPTYANNTDYVRQYKTVPQANANLENGGIVTYTVGWALGGSTAINNMVFNRLSPFDYDEWARITNDVGWNYSNMLKYFKKSEDYQGDFPSDQHGYGGPIPVSRPRYAPGLESWLAAGRSLGYPIADPNGPQKISFTPREFSKRFGRRVSAYTGYISPFLRRKNLKVIANAEASRLVFNGNRAVGVRFFRNSTRGVPRSNFVRARKEVIVSAGIIGSPLLLLRSGIGPRNELTRAKIQVVKDLPVGKDIHYQPVVGLTFVINNNSRSLIYDPERDLTPETLRIYNAFGDGPYSSSGGYMGQALLASSVATRDGNPAWPDILLFPINSPRAPSVFPPAEGIEMAENEAPVRCGIALGRPKSRGTIRLNENNVDGDPILDFQFLSNPQDVQVLLEGIQTTLKIYEQTPPFQNLGARLAPINMPACDHLQYRSEEFWRCFIRQKATTFLHSGGSCRMGTPQDPRAVMDSRLRVIGVNGLRVVDASILPNVVNSNTHAAVYGIAEKASDAILEDWE